MKIKYKDFLNEMYKEKEPFMNIDFKDKLVDFLNSLGLEDVEVEQDGVSFYNPNYNDDELVNKNTPLIHDFIENYGYDADEFIIHNSRIFFLRKF
jgi:hypothetical protein